LQPDIKNIFVILDCTFTSQLFLKDIKKIKEEYKTKVNIQIIDGKILGLDEFTKALKDIPKNSSILITSLLRLADGTVFNFKEGISYVYKYTKKPIYQLIDVGLNTPGVVGGVITSSVLQGQYAAHMARQILEININPSIIPILTKCPTKIILDYKELSRFHLDLNRIPSEAILINEPPSFVKILKERERRIFLLEILIIALVCFFVLFLLNYIKRRKLQQELLEKNLQFNTLINGSDDMIFLKDGEGRWLIANEKGINIFHLKNIDFIGKTDRELAEILPFFKEEFIDCANTDEQAWLEEKSKRFVKTFDVQIGKKRIFDIIKTPIFDNKGNRKYLIVIGRDITEYKELEEQLIHSQKMELLGTIAGGIAHDFNNILSSLMMNAELLQLKIKDKSILKYVENIIKGLDSAAGLVKKIKIISRKERVSFKPIDFKDVLKRTITLVKPIIPLNITLDINYKEGEEYILLGDVNQLTQVIMNLIINAKDAILESKKIKGQISISMEKDNENLVLYVRDNGCGIEKEYLNKIFEPFFTTKKDVSQRGTGLGLSITKSIVKDHNGEIQVESKPGEGTTFILKFPLASESSIIDKPETEVFLKDSLKGKRILIIDDEEDILNAAKEMLTYLGFKVTLAHNGEEALKILDEHKEDIDIIFVDWKMPVLDGKQTIEKIREKGINLPIFIVSGYIDSTIKEFHELNLVKGIINKPFTKDKLIKKLNSLA
jgi:PAS domain S-box-containing protein